MNYYVLIHVHVVSGLAVSAPDEIEIVRRWPSLKFQVLTRVASTEHCQLLGLDLHAIVAKYINRCAKTIS